MIFVDTGAWFASTVPSDADYPAASTWLNQNSEILITTDYVIDETLTLLRIWREKQRAIALDITQAFGFDRHFHQFGSVQVIP